MQHEVNAYPNPVKANTALNFIFSLNHAYPISFEWADISGKVISKEEVTSGSSIDVPDVAPGIYLLKILKGNNAVVKKIMIE